MTISTQQVQSALTSDRLPAPLTHLTNEAEPSLIQPIPAEAISVQLPAKLAKVLRTGAGDELNDFASYALTRFMLREHWIELEDCPLLPFSLQMTNDVVDYQLAPDRDTAIRQAESIGEEAVIEVELDLGFTVIETFEDENEVEGVGIEA